jgi:hypothetical protein
MGATGLAADTVAVPDEYADFEGGKAVHGVALLVIRRVA